MHNRRSAMHIILWMSNWENVLTEEIYGGKNRNVRGRISAVVALKGKKEDVLDLNDDDEENEKKES